MILKDIYHILMLLIHFICINKLSECVSFDYESLRELQIGEAIADILSYEEALETLN